MFGKSSIAKEQFRGRAVEAENKYFHGKSDSPSIAVPLGTPRACQNRRGQVQQPRPFLPERPVHEQHAGDMIGINDMVTAPLLDVILELTLGDSPHRRRPRDAVPGGEIDQEVGCLRQVGTMIDALARLRAMDGDGVAALGVDQAGQSLYQGRLGLPRPLPAATIPCFLSSLDVQIDPAQSQRVGLCAFPVDLP